LTDCEDPNCTCCEIPSDCAVDELCRRPDGECSMAGTCVTVPTLCPGDYNPVCGCNGTTYSNECEALASLQSIASQGTCSP
jgi:hypothetical protein